MEKRASLFIWFILIFYLIYCLKNIDAKLKPKSQKHICSLNATRKLSRNVKNLESLLTSLEKIKMKKCDEKVIEASTSITIMSIPDRYKWVNYTGGDSIPENAVYIGTSGTSTVYVCRTMIKSNLLTGKYVPELKACLQPMDRIESYFKEMELLIAEKGSYTWVPMNSSSNIDIPYQKLIIGGYILQNSYTKIELYIGKGPVSNGLTTGFIHSQTKILTSTFYGHEIEIKSYEVLVKT